MKKGRKNQSQSVFNEESLHFRLCHGCWHLNESISEVTQCERCHRVFPTQYSSEMIHLTRADLRMPDRDEEGEADPPIGTGMFPTELWEEEDEDEDEDDLFTEEESEDSNRFGGESIGLTGLRVRW